MDEKRERIYCECTSVEDSAYPDITMKIGDESKEVSLVYESKYYLRLHKPGECRVMLRSEYIDSSLDYTNVWIMGEPFLKAYYSFYSLEEEHIGLIRVADATRSRYTTPDDFHLSHLCTKEEADDENFSGRIHKCTSFDSCYVKATEKYDNEKCLSKHESCSAFLVDGNVFEGCILSKHCGKIGSYKGNEGIEYICPSDIKEAIHHQPLAASKFETKENKERVETEKNSPCESKD